MDEPRIDADHADRGTCLLLVALARQIVAQGREFRPGATSCRAAPRLRRRHGAADGRAGGGRLPYRPPQLLFPRVARRRLGGDREASGFAGSALRRALTTPAGRTALPGPGFARASRTGGWRNSGCTR